jgi:hypothetical protein
MSDVLAVVMHTAATHQDEIQYTTKADNEESPNVQGLVE